MKLRFNIKPIFKKESHKIKNIEKESNTDQPNIKKESNTDQPQRQKQINPPKHTKIPNKIKNINQHPPFIERESDDRGLHLR
ncbi:hypothetical protein Hanom_Chr01g00057051 [Helianthus anomalus]